MLAGGDRRQRDGCVHVRWRQVDDEFNLGIREQLIRMKRLRDPERCRLLRRQVTVEVCARGEFDLAVHREALEVLAADMAAADDADLDRSGAHVANAMGQRTLVLVPGWDARRPRG